jgi:hypothetical protein
MAKGKEAVENACRKTLRKMGIAGFHQATINPLLMIIAQTFKVLSTLFHGLHRT